jgi:glycosyltransferase involved in cell wall biosynthesis
VALYVGRLAPEKNLTRLTELAQALPDCKLVIVGEGPARATLEARLGNRARFTGQLQGHALATAYASADFFAFPSLTETYGQVLQEAMAGGLPVLAMRAGGVLEVIDDGRTGLLCHPSAWVETARRLVASPALRSSLGAEGRAVALTRSWAAIFDQLLADYRLLANAPQVRSFKVRPLRRAG